MQDAARDARRRDFRAIRPLRRAPVNPIQHIAELGRRDHHSAVRRSRPDEAPAFQPLREQARALSVMPDDLHEIAAPATEHEQVPRVRIGFQRLLHQQRQARKAAPHVCVPGWPATPGRRRRPSCEPGPGSRRLLQLRDDGGEFGCIDISVDADNAAAGELDFENR